jgi:hypothetical protein
LAIWIVCANQLIGFGGARHVGFAVFLNGDFAGDFEAGAGKQYDKGCKGEEVLHRITCPA